ncbi:MAG: helix-turn-helix domain-containing protein [Chloroflexota bacterium]|nr:helix-turn-helix domain-containing protein [Chloroflexota bacterium]
MQTTGFELDRAAPLLLRIHPDVTQITSLGRTTIYSEIAAGRLHAIKIGRSVRIHRDELERWINEHTTGAKADAA